MSRRARICLAGLLAITTLCLAGCPNAVLPAGDQATTTDEQQTMKVLGESVLSDDTTQIDLGDPAAVAVSDSEAAVMIASSPVAEIAPQALAIESPDQIDIDPDTVFGNFLHDGGIIRARGGLAGVYFNEDPTRPGGQFHGRWFAANGDPIGTLGGHYRPVPPDELPPGIVAGGVFEGRFVDSDGNYRGTIRGRYGHRAGQPGLFFGRWFDRNNQLIGILGGRWIDEPETDGGVFRGHWAAINFCDEAGDLSENLIPVPPAVDPEAGDDVMPSDEQSLDLADQLLAEEVESTDIFEQPDLQFGDGDVPCVPPDAHFGFLRGWHVEADPPDPNVPGPHGVLRGHWRDARGVLHGHFVGRWRALPPDHEPGPVRGTFRARWVDEEGNIHGTLTGVYGVGRHGLGVFRGRYFDADGQPLGVMFGRWGEAPDRPGGPMFGVWIGVDFPDQQP